MKKLILFLLCAALMACSGCMPMIEKEYTAVSPHKPSPEPEATSEIPTAEAGDYRRLYDAIVELVESHGEHGRIRLVGYSGDVESDISSACMDVANNTPIGAYAVYYINGSVSKIVSYYEADITVTYKKSAEQTAAVIPTDSAETLCDAVRSALLACDTTLAVRASASFASEEIILTAVKELYYGDPSLAAVYPEASVTGYPQAGTDRIFEVTFSYKYLRESLLTMREKLEAAADEAVKPLLDASDASALRGVVEALMSVTAVEKKWNGSGTGEKNSDDTAYGALVRGSASDEGFASALTLLCRRLGIECVTVLGRRSGADCCWNIVTLDGKSYHVDVCRCVRDGFDAGYLKTDAEMSDEYLWNRSDYPECS